MFILAGVAFMALPVGEAFVPFALGDEAVVFAFALFVAALVGGTIGLEFTIGKELVAAALCAICRFNGLAGSRIVHPLNGHCFLRQGRGEILPYRGGKRRRGQDDQYYEYVSHIFHLVF
jgi:hypothetical protein